MGRKIFIVSPQYTEMYESLTRALVGDKDVEIIYDRRVSDRKAPRRTGSIWSHGPLADVGDRRMASHVDDDLRTRGWAVVRVEDAAPPLPA
jgi:hypothetical protein